MVHVCVELTEANIHKTLNHKAPGWAAAAFSHNNEQNRTCAVSTLVSPENRLNIHT